MKKIFFINPAFLFFTAINFLSCGKGVFGDARVDGIVKDKTTEEVIAGATVYLLESENDNCLFCPTITYIIDSTTTDNEGCFEINYDNKNGYTYSVNAVKEHYIDNQLQTYINNLGSGIDIEVFLDPEAFLKLRVHNENVYEPSDHISVSNIYEVFYGNDVDTSIIFKVYGNTITKLVWFVYEDGETGGSQFEEIYCPSFDTTYFEILY